METWKYFADVLKSYYTLFIVIVVNIIGFMNGMSTGWTSPVLVKLQGFEDNPLGRPITNDEGDSIGAVMPFGAAFGPILFMKAAEIWGKRKCLVVAQIPSIIGYLILMFAKRIEYYYVARFFLGITMGGNCSLMFVYLAEVIFSTKNRGSYLALSSPVIQGGILATYCIGPYLSLFNFNTMIFTLTLVATLLLAFSCPDSPYYVMKMEGKEATRNVLRGLQVTEIEEELVELQKTAEDLDESLLVLFKSTSILKPMFMATGLLLLQGFSGMGVVMLYNQQIFLKTNGMLPSEQSSIIIGIMQVLTSSTAPFTFKRFARRSMLTVSLIGISCADMLLGLYFQFENKLDSFNWLPLVCLISFVLFYNFALDILPWVYLAEIFPQNMKTVGPALCSSLNCVALIITSYTFSKIPVNILFYAYSAWCFCGIFFVRFCLKETKGVSNKEIGNYFNKS